MRSCCCIGTKEEEEEEEREDGERRSGFDGSGVRQTRRPQRRYVLQAAALQHRRSPRVMERVHHRLPISGHG